MKALKIILLTLAIIIVAALVTALILPKEMSGRAEVVINQPKHQVFDYVKHLKNMDEYSIWNQLDPDMKQEYDGTDGTVGFTASWESDHKRVGEGRQTITQVVDGERLETEVYFEDYEDPMHAVITTEDTDVENQTLVVWEAHSKMPFPFNLMGLFYNIENDLSENLQNLKEVLEQQETQTVNNKAFLLGYYEQTQERLQSVIGGLSKEQLHYKSAADAWSISQCLEHIVNTEGMLFEMCKEIMAAPAAPDRKSEVESTDEELLSKITDRSEKFKAPEMLHFDGKYNQPDAAMEDLLKQRAITYEFVQGLSEDSLRDHIADFPAGTVDAYQAFLFIAGHTARHTAQIEEVKAGEGFPE